MYKKGTYNLPTQNRSITSFAMFRKQMLSKINRYKHVTFSLLSDDMGYFIYIQVIGINVT